MLENLNAHKLFFFMSSLKSFFNKSSLKSSVFQKRKAKSSRKSLPFKSNCKSVTLTRVSNSVSSDFLNKIWIRNGTLNHHHNNINWWCMCTWDNQWFLKIKYKISIYILQLNWRITKSEKKIALMSDNLTTSYCPLMN